MGARRQMIALGLIAAAVVCASGCGDDDESDTDTSAVAVARPEDALNTFATGLEGQGLDVSHLPPDELHGAEAGRRITGSKNGTALIFKTGGEANDYADKVAQSGDDKTATVGTAVFVAPTQDDADFFADAYTG